MSLAFYQSNVEKSKNRIKQLEKQINRNALYRLLSIVCGGIIIFQLFNTNNILLVLTAIFLVILVFSFLIYKQSQVDRKLNEQKIFLQVNENEINILNKQPSKYDQGKEFEDQKHPYSADLDIFGANSLFAFINRCSTKDGVSKLANWLSVATNKQEICDRQQAVEELSKDPEHLQSFQSKMFFNLGSLINLRSYIDGYFHNKSFEFGNKFIRFYVPIVPWIFLIGILFSILVFNISSYLIILGIIHLLWTMSQGGAISQFSNRIDKVGVLLIGFAQAIKLIEDKTYQNSLCKNIQQEILVDKQQKKLSSIINDLGKLIDKLDVRNNMLVGAILNILFLWDFKQVMAISKWKNNYEDNILNGFESISTYECLVSLSVLSYNFPKWTKPLINDDLQEEIIAVEIKHPLIASEQSVGNNYSSIDHSIALITGSNMAGKSTFLRTIGINAVLAYAGAVVCANKFELPIYDLLTYMRIKDSLNESTSTFKAELDRMKFILDRVEQINSSFFLVDEMLRGTNSVDKYLGSKAIIKKLINLQGKGMLATHDLQLSELAEQYPNLLKNYHFDIQVQDTEMLFDYKLKEGACTIFNASLLLKGIGVIVESEKVN